VQAFQLTQPKEKKLVVASGYAAGGAAPAPNGGQAGQITTLEQAIAVASRSGKPILAFFYSPEVPAARRAWEEVVQSAEFRQLASNHVFAAIDVSGAGMANCYRYGLFKVPSMVELSPTGQLQKKIIRVGDIAEVRKELAATR
jgi:hypothetical protein